MSLSPLWDNEAYVSTHLVQEMLEIILPKRGGKALWVPEFAIKFPTSSDKYVDFYITDLKRNIEFLVEVKSAKTRIDDSARFQLDTYLRYAKIRYGLLIDPFLIEIYEFKKGSSTLISHYVIQDPTDAEAAAIFLDLFLESIKMRTITIHTSKGGVGKTTLVVNLAYELAKMGQRVLVIDLDDQANTSLTLGVNKTAEFAKIKTLAEFKQLLTTFENRPEVIEFITEVGHLGNTVDKYRNCIYPAKEAFFVGESEGKIDVLPGSYKTTPTKLPQTPSQARLLNRALLKLAGDYDYAIIDTSPNFNLVTWNGLYAGQYLVIPSQLEYFSVFGVLSLLQHIKTIQEETDYTRANVLGVIPMMVENVILHNTVKAFVEEKLSQTTIRLLTGINKSVYIGQASLKCQPVTSFAIETGKGKPVAQQFANFAKEVVHRINDIEKCTA